MAQTTTIGNKTIKCDSIYGLSDLLFPRKDLKENGFRIPKDSTNTSIPKIILIKGAPGSGKSTLTAQLVFEVVKNAFKTTYWYTHGDCDYLENAYRRIGIGTTEEIETVKHTLKKLPIEYVDQDIKVNEPKTPFWTMVGNFFIPENQSQIAKYQTSLMENDVLFVDSINIHDVPDRQLVRGFFNTLLSYKLLCFVCVEDYLDQGTPETKQLIADCDFKADVIIELREEDRNGYTTRSIKVPKMRYSPQMYGKHLMKICSPWHSLYTINKKTGVVIYHALSNHFSESRVDTFLLSNDFFVKTGITHLDSILLPHQSTNTIEGKSIPPNATIVIQGTQGGYMLPIGMNILMGGMWDYDEKSETIGLGDDVLAILLNEETNIDLSEFPMPFRTDKMTNKTCGLSLDNGNWIQWRRHIGVVEKENMEKIASGLWDYLVNATYLDRHGNVNKNMEGVIFEPPYNGMEDAAIDCINRAYHGRGHKGAEDRGEYQMGCQLHELFNAGNNFNQKVVINKWCGYITNKNSIIGCRKLVIANFRPGNITPEEFASTVKLLLKNHRFKRVLFYSTAQIPMRFPQLANEKLFLPVLIDIFKARNVVSVFIDPHGDGRDENVSFGLSNMADYIIDIRDETALGPNEQSARDYKLPEKMHKNDMKNSKRDLEEDVELNVDECSWAKLYVHNIRGQTYAQVPHSVTIRPRILKKLTVCELQARMLLPDTDAYKLYQYLQEKSIITENGELCEQAEENSKTIEEHVLTDEQMVALQNFLRTINADMKELNDILIAMKYKKRIGTELFLFNLRSSPDGKTNATGHGT